MMRKNAGALIAVLLLAVAGAAGWWVWHNRQAAPVALPEPVPVAEPAPPAPAPSAPEVRYPIGAAAGASGAAGGGASGVASDVASAPPDNARSLVEAGLNELLGPRTVLKMLQVDQFVARVVATVDNLGRGFAAPRLWPVNPTAGRFEVVKQGGQTVISAANHARYAAFVALVSQLDAARTVALYTRFYPLFQRAHEDLGYPRQHFNDRLVDVIDLLLATPEPVGPVAVHLVEISGPVKPVRPWVRYEYLDPALQALPAGPRMLLRLSPADRQQVKAKLQQLRALLVAPR